MPLNASRLLSSPDLRFPDARRPHAPARRRPLPGALLGLLLWVSLCAAPAAQAQAAAPEVPATAASAAPVAAAASAAGSDLTESGADQPGITWTLSIEAPQTLRPLLERYLDLSRYQRSDVGGAITRTELTRLLAAAPGQVRQLLETEGYFAAKARAVVSDATPGANAPVAVTLHVEPGPPTRVASIDLDVVGALSVAADSGDPAAAALLPEIRRRWSLREGQTFTREGWDDAKTAVLTLLRTEGYAGVAWDHTAAAVDADRQRADLQLTLNSGPLFRFGALNFEGLDHVRLDAVMALRNFTPGAALREQVLLNYQDRLVKTGLFDTITVTYEPDPELAAATPVLVRVRERQMQQATVGVGISDLSGPRVTLEHLHQRPWGFGWQAKTKLQLGRDARSLSVDLTSHPQPGPYRNLVSGAVSRTDASGLRVISERARLGRTQDTERVERTYYVELQRAFTRDLGTQAITDDTSAVSLNYQWVWRQLDHPVLPTRGWAVSADGAVGHSFASTDRSGWFGRATTRVTSYWTVLDNWYGQARLEAGNVFARPTVAVPYTLLFRAGGDDSVRGYGYQSLGPTDSSGSAVGGRVLATGSLELARPFSLSHPAWWGAAFVDAGNAADDWGAWRAALGYGVGVRWRSPVGPLRIDLAYGQQVHRVRLHFTVGLTF